MFLKEASYAYTVKRDTDMFTIYMGQCFFIILCSKTLKCISFSY